MNLISLLIHWKPYGAAQFLIQTFLKISRRGRDVSIGRVVMKDEDFQLPENGQHPSGSIPFKNPIQKCFCSFHFDSALGLALGRIPAIAELSCMTHGHKNQLPVLFVHRNLCGAACRALSSKTFLLKSSTASFFPPPGETYHLLQLLLGKWKLISVCQDLRAPRDDGGPGQPHLGPSPWAQEPHFSSAWRFESLLHRAAGVPQPKFQTLFPGSALPPWMFLVENVYSWKLNVIIRKLEIKRA